jgi:hypothetical protein
MTERAFYSPECMEEEFREVRYPLAPRPVHGEMRRLAAFVTVCTNAPVGMRVRKGEEKACDEWRLR